MQIILKAILCFVSCISWTTISVKMFTAFKTAKHGQVFLLTQYAPDCFLIMTRLWSEVFSLEKTRSALMPS